MKPVETSCTRLDPIDRAGLEELIKSGKANPNVIKTLKCKPAKSNSLKKKKESESTNSFRVSLRGKSEPDITPV